MATLIELQADAWHNDRFGKVNVPATYRKLLEEVGELGEAIMKGDPESCSEEIGDVLLVLRHIVRGAIGEDKAMMILFAVALDKCERRLHAAQAAKPQEVVHERPRIGSACERAGRTSRML